MFLFAGVGVLVLIGLLLVIVICWDCLLRALLFVSWLFDELIVMG